MTTIPDRLRGRLAGIEQVSYSSGPLLGNVEAGVVASIAGVRVSIVSGRDPVHRRGGRRGGAAAGVPALRGGAGSLRLSVMLGFTDRLVTDGLVRLGAGGGLTRSLRVGLVGLTCMRSVARRRPRSVSVT